jgi:hypothetical protein
MLVCVLFAINSKQNKKNKDLIEVEKTCKNIAVYSQMKDEHDIFNNWIDHYFKIGFDHIYVVDDQSEPKLETLIIDHPRYNDITIIYSDVSNDDYYSGHFTSSELYDSEVFSRVKYNKQAYLLNVFRKRYEDDIDWLMICDADEFLYLRDHDNVKDYISYLRSKHSDLSGIKLRWLLYGSSYHSYYPKGHLFKEFTLSSEYLNTNEKSIVRLKDVEDIDSHWCILKPNCNYYHYYENSSNIEISNDRILNEPDKPIEYQNVNAFIAHYITLDCYNFVKCRLRRQRAMCNEYRDNSCIDGLNMNNDIVNTVMCKYIDNNNEIDQKQPKKQINIELYNQINGTNFNTLYDIVMHFYENKTELIYTSAS